MPFTFTVKKQKDMQETLANIKKWAEKARGGDIFQGFQGDEKSGSISADGVRGSYTVGADSIEITVTEKPEKYPQIIVEAFIKKMFKECSVD